MEFAGTRRKINYLLTLPGILRLAQLVLGLTCIVLSLVGFDDDFGDGHTRWNPVQGDYYGEGYSEERANIWSLIITCTCFTVSAVLLLLLIIIDDAVTRWEIGNRFLNLFLAFLLFCGWLCAVLGSLLFRQGCCRVEIFTNQRISHELDGYFQNCLCYINPHNDPERSYPVQSYQDVPAFLDFVAAEPHHFTEHVANLVLMSINVLIYFLSACIVN